MHTVHVTFGLRDEYGLEMVEVVNTSQAESQDKFSFLTLIPLANILKHFAPGAGTPTFVTEVLRLVSNVQLVKWLLLLNERLEWPQLCISYPIHVWYGKIVPYAYGTRNCTIRVWYVPYAYGTYHTRMV